VIAEEGGEGG